MPLNSQQKEIFLTALVNAFTLEKFTMMLSFKLSVDLTVKFNVAQSREKIFFDVINWADNNNLTEELARAALESQPGNQLLKDFVDNNLNQGAQPATASQADYYQSCYFRGKRLFIARPDLRTILRRLREDSDTSRILFVTGARSSGKTFTYDVIAYLESKPIQNQNAIHRPVHIDLDLDRYSAFGVVEFISPEFGDISNDPVPLRGEEAEAAYVAKLCNWLARQVRKTNDKIWWFIFDGFERNPLLPGTKELISQWAQKIYRELPQARLIILNYKDGLLPELETFVERENIGTIWRDEMIEFFKKLYAEKNVNDADENIIIENVDEIIRQTEEKMLVTERGSELRLKLLSEAAYKAAQKLFP